ncbi:3-deoxy-7-phosphoheptulonate synthase [Nocardia spumae]|uniref:3-deoxy-7-phosphoheptulonate synthase n=1 Tax=Nocardia spumae TaxID=2887190 RepID=UPI001D15BA22|nr:3-deoxy-7-phosphoheptulonate synthase [Nocardia spumae]
MTAIGSTPGPLGEPSPGGPGFRTPTDEQVQRFHHPLTRNLLADEGFTTLALERILGTSLAVRVLRQDEVPARVLPATVADDLRLHDDDRALIRRSCLVTSDLITASVNYVVAVAQPASANGLDDVRTPIGHGLINRGRTARRHLVWAGPATWPDGRQCATKAYIMTIGDRPVCYIREAFNPAVVPPEHSAPAPSPRETAEPKPAGRTEPVPPPRTAARCARRLPRPAADRSTTLTSELAQAARGRVFALHLDQRAAVAAPDESRGAALLYAAAAVLTHLVDIPVIVLGPDTPDSAPPLEQSAELLRRAAPRFPGGRIATMLGEVAGLLPAAGTPPPSGHELFSSVPQLYPARELPPPAADTRRHRDSARAPGARNRPHPRLWFTDSGHDPAPGPARAVWTGDPLAVRLDPALTPSALELLCRRTNPHRQPGRLTLIPPPGTGAERLTAWQAAAAASGVPVGWLCAPTASAGCPAEIRTFFRTCGTAGMSAAGLTLPGPDTERALRCVLSVASEIRID